MTGQFRAASYGERNIMTPQEVEATEGKAIEKAKYENQRTDPNQGAEDKTNKNCNPISAGGSGAGGRDCGYNAGWKDTTIQVMRVNGQPRASFTIYPKNGQAPKGLATNAAQQAALAKASLKTASGGADLLKRKRDALIGEVAVHVEALKLDRQLRKSGADGPLGSSQKGRHDLGKDVTADPGDRGVARQPLSVTGLFPETSEIPLVVVFVIVRAILYSPSAGF